MNGKSRKVKYLLVTPKRVSNRIYSSVVFDGNFIKIRISFPLRFLSINIKNLLFDSVINRKW